MNVLLRATAKELSATFDLINHRAGGDQKTGNERINEHSHNAPRRVQPIMYHFPPSDQLADERPHPRKRPRLTKRGRLHIRLAEIDRMLTDRYGPRLPDTDEARDDLRPLIQHALLIGPERARELALRLLPELEGEELDAMVSEGGFWWGDDELGVHLEFTDADRTRLKTWTIGGCDVLKAERIARRRRKRRAADRARRAKAGAAPRRQSAERTRPWEAEGISRATYYRRKASTAPETGETVSRPAILDSAGGAAQSQPANTGGAAANKNSLVEAAPPVPAIVTTRAEEPASGRPMEEPASPSEPAPTTARAESMIDGREMVARLENRRRRSEWLVRQQIRARLIELDRRSGIKLRPGDLAVLEKVERVRRERCAISHARRLEQMQSPAAQNRRARMEAALAEAIKQGLIEGRAA